ncbi:SpoIIE family protein phosphatase [Acuticoccus sp. MNP-M23]|uniref:SpoIIE family protein phosphatase n=1 Tax=Acuticoccus sp. MNP-M23 TaxID=3072793 RepID=UPI002815C7BA|nr:SpoIIE family protein phosphatase [Acuticoccus sp. MNP-M23]WMS42987.1 SpoIIE family protein phosphatase [Acuticoccus sp. MNP-M23]
MLLRTRVTLLFACAIVLIGLALLAVGFSQRQYQADRLGAIAVALQRSLWENLVANKMEDLEPIATDLAARIATLAPSLSRDDVGKVIGDSPAVTSGITVQVVDLDAELVSANAPLFRAAPLIDAREIATLTGREQIIAGLRQDSPDRFMIAVIRPIVIRGVLAGALSVAVDAAATLQELALDIGEPAYLLSPRGRLATGTDVALWTEAADQLPRRPREPQFIATATRDYYATPMTLNDISGRPTGTLVALRDVTESREASERVERLGLIGVALAGLIILAGVYFLMRNAFKPLEGAVGALDALSKGDLSRPLESEGTGEIARIGEAVAVFRRNAQRLNEQDEGIARQRRRQERVIRRELQRLAELLDDEGRAEILSDLAEVLPDGKAGVAPANTELATLATLLQRMSTRIADQQTRLTELITELKAAIVTRARLAALEQELDIARELQTSFLPKPLPPHPSFDVFGLMESAKEVGGDFFDIFMIDENRLGMVIADVSGKGVPAAMFMAITRTLIRATALTSPSPAATVGEVNSFLAADNEQMMFVTLFHGVLHLDTGEFAFANAGHNPPYVLAAGGLVTLPRASGPALAVVEDIAYKDDSIVLAPGSTFFAYTDGVTEAFSRDGTEYGTDKLEAFIVAHAAETPAALCADVRADVLAFEDGADQFDDVTCFALRYDGAPPAA